ncbi:MAG TPA: glycoside hydrolase family 15 protein, partial [Miltoncostaeaceae bacterium]|nr:glycoside hydrolase family 15 protein [Miltoncostaeaceae bacterium]
MSDATAIQPDTLGATDAQESRFPPIADYAFLSDCEVSALVASSGNVEWMCLPRHDAPSVFGALLDRAVGRFGFAPYGKSVPAGRRYLPGSLVLETTWQTPTGWIIVTDALCVGPWHDVAERSPRHRRIPRDYEAEGVLLRTARCVKGSVQMLLNCFPVFDYGRRNARWEYAGAGYGEAVATAEGADVELRLTSSLRLGIEGSRAVAISTLRDGEKAFAALSWSGRTPPADPDEAAAWIEGTLVFWREWIAGARFPEHQWAPYLRRSALTLKGLTYAPSGALLAASTTSLPEAPGGNRNWDYRYTWIRDSTLMLKALHYLNLEREAFDYFGFIGEVLAAQPDIQIMYGIDGERQLDEATLDHLSGYGGARPVRTGNGAYTHIQLDVWGAALDSVYIHVQHMDNLPERLWLGVRHLVETA